MRTCPYHVLSSGVSQALIKSFGAAVVGGVLTGDEIADTFFFEDAKLRGTVSAMLRKLDGGVANEFAVATNGVTSENNIAQFFTYFSGSNLADLDLAWRKDEDDATELAPNLFQMQMIREFQYKNSSGAMVTLAAVFSFLVQKRVETVKIVSLISYPIFGAPPVALNETVTLP